MLAPEVAEFLIEASAEFKSGVSAAVGRSEPLPGMPLT